ncbi:MAG: hypothetical protein NZ739_04470 [Verrucomicrobiae bacterium]|nr:hypothetical protein [Verrucomicrobiae bacterium]MCX7723054.1 hypothetical protein [Verrucomicrobiae bacterium]
MAQAHSILDLAASGTVSLPGSSPWPNSLLDLCAVPYEIYARAGRRAGPNAR